MYSNCMMPKPKAYSSKKYKKFHGIAQKLSCIDKKVWKMEVKWKAFCWGDHNLTPYNYSKKRPAWCDVKTHKRFEYVFLITNWFWDGMAQLTVWQMVLQLRSWVWVIGVSLWGRDCWGDHNLTPYNYCKNRPTWCDVKAHKRLKCVFFITNWF